MSDASRLRDSTQIILPTEALDGMREDIEAEFTVTVLDADGYTRIIGSPVVIKRVSTYLARHGVSVR